MIILVHKIFLLTQSVVKWLWRKTEQDDDIDDRSLFLSKKDDEYLPEVCDQSDATTNFSFLCDKRTIYHIQKGKIMFIMRGVSGSGKSTLVNLICKIYKDVSVCSADQYFMKHGEYQFDHRNLSTAHENCSKKATKACLNGVPVIVIDNTNVKRWEMGNYLSLALSNNYAVVIVRPKTSWCNNPEKLAEFNKHGVTADIIRAKLRTFEEITPLYFGWFISEEQSNTLYDLARKSLDECIKLFPQLKDLLLFQSPDLFQEIEKEVTDCILKCKEWYGWHFPELKLIITNDLIYARTVKMLGNRRNAATTDFSSILPKFKEDKLKSSAAQSMGSEISDEDIILISDLCEQIIELSDYKDQVEEFRRNPVFGKSPKVTRHVGEVIGSLLISHADAQEKTLFNHFKLNLSKILHCTAKFMGTKRNPAPGSDTYRNMDIVQSSYGSVHDLTITRITVTPRTIGAKIELSPNCLELYDKPQEREREVILKRNMGDNSVSLEFGRAAHVTIGTTPDVPPVKANDDLLDILDEEMKCKINNIELQTKSCALGTVVYAGKDLFVVTLKNPITIQGLYTGFYGGGNSGSPNKR